MKRNKILILSLITLLIFSSFPVQADDSNLQHNDNKTYEQLAELSESIVLIKAYNEKGEVEKFGSGVVISENGLIITNYHVLEGGVYFGVVMEGMEEGYEYGTINVLGLSQEADLGLIKINVPTKPLNIGTTENLKKGQKVVAIGNPLGFENTISDGIISAIRDFDGVEVIQTTTPISPGSSGGALMDMNGDLIGITTLVTVDGQNLNFAVSSKHIFELLEDKNTKMNMEIWGQNGLFEYGDSSIVFDTFNYHHNNKHIINLISNNETKMDFSIFILSENFRNQVEELYINNIQEIAKKYEIKDYEFNLFAGESTFTYQYYNGKIKNKKWTYPKNDSKSKENILKINLGNEIYSLDHQLTINSDEYHIISNMFEGLMTEKNGEMQLAMAKNYTVSDDGKTYTFYLKDAKWSDGEPVKASHFEYAWKKALNPDEFVFDAFKLYCIEGAQNYNEGTGRIEDVKIKAINDKTLQVKLTQPTPYFVKLISLPVYLPLRKDIVEQSPYDWAENPITAISNGPFRLEEFEEGTKVTLVKNDEYYNKSVVKLDKIEFYMFEDEDIAISAYNAGRFDVVEDISLQNISKIKDKDKVVKKFSSMSTWYFKLNTTNSPFDNVKVRKALSLAIDRKSIIDNVLKNTDKPATGFVSPGIYTSEGNDFRDMAGDYGIEVDKIKMEEAKKLLAEAGYPNGENFPESTILCSNNETNKAICEATKDMLEKTLGIKVNIEIVEFGTMLEREAQGEYMIVFSGWTADYPDPMTFLELMTSDIEGGQSGWLNDEYNKLIDESNSAKDKERDEMLIEAEKILIEDSVIIPIFYETDNVIVNENIKNIDRTGYGYWHFGRVETK